MKTQRLGNAFTKCSFALALPFHAKRFPCKWPFRSSGSNHELLDDSIHHSEPYDSINCESRIPIPIYKYISKACNILQNAIFQQLKKWTHTKVWQVRRWKKTIVSCSQVHPEHKRFGCPLCSSYSVHTVRALKVHSGSIQCWNFEIICTQTMPLVSWHTQVRRSNTVAERFWSYWEKTKKDWLKNSFFLSTPIWERIMCTE